MRLWPAQTGLSSLEQSFKGHRFRSRQDGGTCLTVNTVNGRITAQPGRRLSVAVLFLPFNCSQSVRRAPSLWFSVFVCDEGRDLLSCLSVWAGLGACCLTHSSLAACQPVWQSCLTTPALPRLQKARLQILRACQPVRAFPLVGRAHCHTATLSLLAKFLSRFALLSSCLPFSLIFSLCLFHSSLPCWQHTLSSCPGCLRGFFTFIILIVCALSCLHAHHETHLWVPN